MNDLKDIKVISFDYGGTLDLPSTHWFDFLWELVQTKFPQEIPVTRTAFWGAYVYGEQQLEREVMSPDAGLSDTAMRKCRYEIDYLSDKGCLSGISGEEQIQALASRFAFHVVESIHEGSYKESAEVLSQLSAMYRLNVVSNYYGNLKRVLTEAGFMPYITCDIDSTLVGIRKPDPGIWQLAIKASECRPEQMLVVGDSMKNDILPAQSLGCATAWLTKEVPEGYKGITIDCLSELLTLLNKTL